MKTKNEVEMIFNAYKGIMRTTQLSKEHIFYKDIQDLIKGNIVEKIRYGYYQWINPQNNSEVNTIIHLFPDAIVCMYTALFYYRYSNRVSNQWNLAVSKDSNKSRFKLNYPSVKPYYVETHLIDLGATDGLIDGIKIAITDKERTICDCLKYANRMDKETLNMALRRYIEDPDKNVQNLMTYAYKLRVTKKVRDLIEVWL
jgi:predicted transcriptional regulator of viral defense system